VERVTRNALGISAHHMAKSNPSKQQPAQCLIREWSRSVIPVTGLYMGNRISATQADLDAAHIYVAEDKPSA
jgi:hypothetical protein